MVVKDSSRYKHYKCGNKRAIVERKKKDNNANKNQTDSRRSWSMSSYAVSLKGYISVLLSAQLHHSSIKSAAFLTTSWSLQASKVDASACIFAISIMV